MLTETLVYRVETAVFQGPFDLLLQAIDDGQVDIYQVSLSQITTAYFTYWQNVSPTLVDAADFLYMAAYLLELKSKALLPVRETLALETEEEDLGQTLLSHIEEYKIYKEAALVLKERKEIFDRFYSRHEGERQEREFELVNISLKDLVLAFKRVYDQAVKREKILSITAEEITLEERIEQVKQLLMANPAGVMFENIFLLQTRLEIIVTFLAVLELAKQRFLRVMQDKHFGGIVLFTVETPRRDVSTNAYHIEEIQHGINA